jgi:hypothetical protein
MRRCAVAAVGGPCGPPCPRARVPVHVSPPGQGRRRLAVRHPPPARRGARAGGAATAHTRARAWAAAQPGAGGRCCVPGPCTPQVRQRPYALRPPTMPPPSPCAGGRRGGGVLHLLAARHRHALLPHTAGGAALGAALRAHGGGGPARRAPCRDLLRSALLTPQRPCAAPQVGPRIDFAALDRKARAPRPAFEQLVWSLPLVVRAPVGGVR